MADYNEKVADSSTKSGTETPPATSPSVDEGREHTGKPWMYRTFKIGPWRTPAYVSPQFQIAFVALVCFLCPGMFNAVNGLGAAGLLDPTTADNANTALYSTFAGVGFFAGSIANRIGLQATLGFGGFGYCLYIISILSYNHDGNSGFVIFAGTLLGLCAGMLWTAQGAVMMAYPPEKDKGKYIAGFWMLFNLGGVIGALIPLAQNIHQVDQAAVTDGTYIAFIVLMATGFVLALFLCNPKLVTRDDGSKPVVMKHPTWKTEIFGLYETLRSDWYILLLFPMFFSSNWFYTYQFQDFNLAKFNTRTRALNNVLYWSAQIFGALIFGYALDFPRLRRSTRAKAALGVLLVLTMVIWGGGYDFQKGYTRESVLTDPTKNIAPAPGVIIDFKGPGYIGPMFLYIFYGFYDAAWQTTVYWFMGALTNNTRKLANFAGFYKGIQSAGAAIAGRVDALGTANPSSHPYMQQFGTAWGLLSASLIIAAPVIWMKIKDTVPIEDDIVFSDETLAEVTPVTPMMGAGNPIAGEKTRQGSIVH